MSTIREVAKHAGVSIGTVSKVLNGSDDRVDPVSKERILASIRCLRYKPPPFEKNQKAAIAQNIGLIVPNLTEHPLRRHGYVHFILDGVLERAALRGWSVTIFAETMWDDVGNAVRRKYDGRCDGLIVAAPQPDHDLIPSLHSRGEPVVQIGTTAWLEDVSSVDIDNHEIGRMVAHHLMDLGHQRLGFVGLVRDQVSSLERFEGFQSMAGGRAQKYEVTREEGVSGFAKRFMYQGANRPTALMCWHDGLALDLIPALNELGLSVPGDVSVVGVDDAPEARDRNISLTTVANPVYDLGKRAADMTINRVLDPLLPREIVKLPSELIIRSTTAALSK